ncbi:MAG: hypothetical protein K2K57_12930 [Oscillospiraceae bacterium]|nr:hypothetical protein [Oscillospiraceae bacterium]
MAVYLVDFENVHSAGLMGVERLSEKDSVYIFYSNNSNSMSFEAHEMLKATAAKVIPLHVSSGNKNALDFQLASFTGYLAGTSEDRDVTIISVDTGYTFIQHFWERTMHCTNFMLRFAPSIKRCLQPESMAAQRLEPVNTAVFASSVQQKTDEVFTVRQAEEIDRSEKTADNAKVSQKNEPLSSASENLAGAADNSAQEARTTPINEVEVTEKIQAVKFQNVQEEKSPEPKTENKVIEEASGFAAKASAQIDTPKEKVQKSAVKSAANSKDSKKKADSSKVKQGRNELAAIIKDAGIGKVNTNVICDLVADSKDKQQFYTGMTKAFGMNDGLKIYKALRPEYSNLKKLLSST